MIYNFGINDVPGDSKPSSPFYKCYDSWHGIIRRCYKTDNPRNASYDKTTICNEWQYYSEFKKWFLVNYKEGFQLDKDIIGGDENIYSPSTCAFVPNLLNSCIIDGNRGDKTTPIGVSIDNTRKVTKYGKQVRNFGLFLTEYEAHKVWQLEKIKYLTELIQNYKGVVDATVIDGLQVRIDILSQDVQNGAITETISKVRMTK